MKINSGLKLGGGTKSTKTFIPDIKNGSGIYDFDVDGGTIGDYVIGSLPDNATVVSAKYEVLTTCTDGATDAATIAISTSKAANEIVTATAISAGGNVWDAGYHDTTCDNTAANFTTKTTAVSDVQISIAVAALTAGKIKVWWDYIVSE